IIVYVIFSSAEALLVECYDKSEIDDSRDIITQGLKGFKPLSHSNYIEWRDIIDDYIDSQNWIKFSKEGLPKDASEELRAKLSRIAVVLKTAAGNQRTYLLGLRTPNDILAKLKEVNGGSSRGTLSSLQNQFSSPDSNGKVDNVAALLSQLQAQIGGNKYKVTVETLRIVASDYSFAQIVERLRQAKFEANENSAEIALKFNNNAQSRPGKKESRKCYYCGKVGHIKPKCKKKKSDEKNKQNGAQKDTAENDSIAWMASKNRSIYPDDWCADSGATIHMTSNRSIFIEYENFESTVGTAKANVNLKVVGRGKLCCKIGGKNKIFEGVLYIPELQSKLLSPGKLTSAGLTVNLGPKDITIARNKKVVAKGPRIGDTWVLKTQKSNEYANRATSVTNDEALLWHRHFGYPGAKKLSLASQAVTGMPSFQEADSPACNTCDLTKSIRFQRRGPSENPETKRLERVFIDVWGPYKHRSIGGKRYMFVIVDEYSCMSWVYFMAQKSEVLGLLPEWKHQVELESGERLIKVRSDGVLELKKAIKLLSSIHESTTANTPEQSGKVERMNRTIVTKARSMLAGPDLPKRLWAEAMATACYLRNITSSVEKTMSPYEIWTGHHPSVEHLKVFGCVAYVHVDKVIFVGYRKTTKQYRILDPKTGTIIESSHVTFKKDQKGGSILEITDELKICHHTDVITNQKFDQEEFVEDEENREKHKELCDLDNNVILHEMDQLNNEVTYSSERRSQRIRRPLNRLIEELGRENPQNQAEAALMANTNESEFVPRSYSEAIKYRKWRDAIETTLNSLAGNNTWN
ncbi:Retrovirus-related Pol polyprotein from transposon TNT 1-94, partial [Golovinomyces cichoracearum]